MLRKFILSTFCVLFVFALAINAQEAKQAVIPYETPDPTALESPDGSGIYVFTTGRKITISRSKSIVDWEKVGEVFTEYPAWVKQAIPRARSIWAPDIVYFNDLYHLYYSVSTFGSQRSVIGLVVNKTLNPDDPDYQWIDKGMVLESDPEHTDYNAIDSALFVDDDGKTWLTWGSYWTGLKGVEVDPKTGKPFSYKDGKLKIPADYVSIANRGTGSDTSIEAPYIIRRGGYYYLFTSRGSCCDGVRSTYHIAIGRATAPLGPYMDKEGMRMDHGGGTVILSSTEKWKGTGHNGFFQTKIDDKTKADWIILAAYDSAAPEKQRLTQIRRISWDEDSWPVLGDVLAEPFE